MSRTPCTLIYEDRYYQGLDDLLVRLARELGAWPQDHVWDHMSAFGAGSLREDALRVSQDAEVVIAVGDGDRPRLLLGTDYTPEFERREGEPIADYEDRLSTRWTETLRALWPPAEAARCHGVALLWNQESVLLAAHEHWCLDDKTRAVVEQCQPNPQTLEDAQFAAVFDATRLHGCGASLARALGPQRQSIGKADTRRQLREWARAVRLPTAAERWAARVPGVSRLIETLRRVPGHP